MTEKGISAVSLLIRETIMVLLVTIGHTYKHLHIYTVRCMYIHGMTIFRKCCIVSGNDLSIVHMLMAKAPEMSPEQRKG